MDCRLSLQATNLPLKQFLIELPKLLTLAQGILRESRTESPESFESGLI